MSEPIMQSPLHPFGLAAKARPIDGSKGVWANEVPLLGFISLRGRAYDAAFVEAASAALGGRLPTVPCTWTGLATAKVLWLSPDEWMIVCARDRLATLLADLNRALADIHSQVVDNSGGYTQILLQGANALDVMSHASVYDFALLEPGRVVGTTFGKSSLYVHRQDDGFCLVLRRSFSDYIWRYLERAAAPYGFGVAQLQAGPVGSQTDAA
jgi:sarcosine oxidase subunit gamma